MTFKMVAERTPCNFSGPVLYELTYERTWRPELGLWQDFKIGECVLGPCTRFPRNRAEVSYGKGN